MIIHIDLIFRWHDKCKFLPKINRKKRRDFDDPKADNEIKEVNLEIRKLRNELEGFEEDYHKHNIHFTSPYIVLGDNDKEAINKENWVVRSCPKCNQKIRFPNQGLTATCPKCRFEFEYTPPDFK